MVHSTENNMPPVSQAKKLELIKEDCQPAANILGGQACGPDPFDPAALRIDPRVDAVTLKREILNIGIRKPTKFEPFRTHPTLRIDTRLCMPKGGEFDGEIFLVAPPMWGILARHTVAATLFFVITKEGAPLVAPIPFPQDGKKEHTAHSSFRQIAAVTENHWRYAAWNHATQSYDMVDSTDFGDPVWPDLTLKEILEKAFRDYCIKDTTHPLVRSLGLGPRL